MQRLIKLKVFDRFSLPHFSSSPLALGKDITERLRRALPLQARCF
jgi:hypothetical protein